LQAYFSLNRAIHDAILEATRNDVLITTYRNISRRIMSARYLANKSAKRWAQAVKEHEAILTALEQRDGPALAQILKSHLENKLVAIKRTLRAEEESEAERIDRQRSVAQSSEVSWSGSAPVRGNGRNSAHTTRVRLR
jgi:DNA-binding GntR family transcriptional regulator